MTLLTVLSTLGILLAGVAAFGSFVVSLRQRQQAARLESLESLAHLHSSITVASTVGFKPGDRVHLSGQDYVIERVDSPTSIQVGPAPPLPANDKLGTSA